MPFSLEFAFKFSVRRKDSFEGALKWEANVMLQTVLDASKDLLYGFLHYVRRYCTRPRLVAN